MIRFVGIAVFLDDLPGKAGHGGITVSFRNHMVSILAAAHILIESVCILQKVRQIHFSFPNLDIGSRGAEEETSCVQRLCIKIRKYRIDQSFHITVICSIGHEIYREQNMELRSGGLAVFLTVMKAAVVDRKADAGKSSGNIIRGDPIGWFLRVIIIAVHRQAIAADEVVSVTVVVFIFRAYIVVTDSSFQTGPVRHVMAMGIGAVTGIAGNVRAVKGKHQLNTSSASSSKTCVINFSARIMVSSSQSPPRITSKPSSA